MRKDMKHVLIDRPRTGGDGGKSIPPKGSKKRFQKTPLEEQPKFASSARRRVYGWDAKELNDNLSPLRRWLRSQVGRDWDEVWSEICEGLSIHGALTMHVRDHADKYVEKNCIINSDGEVCDSRGMKLHTWRNFYVHPVTNLLCCEDSHRRYRRQEKTPDWLEGVDEDHRYYLLNNIWYEVTLKPLPKMRAPAHVYDVVMAGRWEGKKKYVASSEVDCSNYYGRKVYAASKRQLGKREIQKLKLWESDLVK